MKFGELVGRVDFNVEFVGKTADLETYAEPGMRAVVVNIKEDYHDEMDTVLVIAVDYSKYDEFNKQFETYNYYDKEGIACLNARQAGWYKPVDTIYVMADDNVEDYMTLINEASNNLYEMFLAAKVDKSYTQWLEQVLVDKGYGVDA